MPSSRNRRANRLRVLRAEADLTQRDLAKRCGIDPSQISLIENGVIEPTPMQREKLATALNQEVDEVFPSFEVDAR